MNAELDRSLCVRLELSATSCCCSFNTVFAPAEHSSAENSKPRCGSFNGGHNDWNMIASLIDYIERVDVGLGLHHLFRAAKSGFLMAFKLLILSRRDLTYRVQRTGANALEDAPQPADKATRGP